MDSRSFTKPRNRLNSPNALLACFGPHKAGALLKSPKSGKEPIFEGFFNGEVPLKSKTRMTSGNF